MVDFWLGFALNQAAQTSSKRGLGCYYYKYTKNWGDCQNGRRRATAPVMPNLFRHPINKECYMAVNLSCGVLKQVQDDYIES